MEEEISKVNPDKRIDVGGFRLDADGNSISRSVPMTKSELFLTEVMENVCKKMDDYVKTTYKKTGKFMLMKIMVDGKMNPESSNVDFVQDGDLNKSLEHYVSVRSFKYKVDLKWILIKMFLNIWI